MAEILTFREFEALADRAEAWTDHHPIVYGSDEDALAALDEMQAAYQELSLEASRLADALASSTAS